MIITFLNQKGGVGKTTLAINVAAALAAQSRTVLLVDADEQRSAVFWSSTRADMIFDIVALTQPNMAIEVMKRAENYDFIVIDGPPRAADVARSCIIASDFVALPIEPSGLSTWAADLTIRQIYEAQQTKPDLRCGFVISRKIGNTVIGREIRNMVGDSGIPILDSAISNRIAFTESLTMGKTIFEYEPLGPASLEITQLTNEICGDVES